MEAKVYKWVEYHTCAWEKLVEAGWITGEVFTSVDTYEGTSRQIAVMIPPEHTKEKL